MLYHLSEPRWFNPTLAAGNHFTAYPSSERHGAGVSGSVNIKMCYRYDPDAIDLPGMLLK
jgi:hypothetical protein